MTGKKSDIFLRIKVKIRVVKRFQKFIGYHGGISDKQDRKGGGIV